MPQNKTNDNQKEYFFVLGKNSKISILEILNYLKNNEVDIVNFKYNENIFLIEINSEKSLNCEKIINDLGGTIKIGEILAETNSLNAKNTAGFLADYLEEFDRIFFGISYYDLKKAGGNFNIKRFGLEIKKYLKEENNKSSRFVSSNEYNLSSVTVRKNKLLHKNGFEINIVKLDNTYYFGRTLAVQDFEDYGDRDFGRPNRDSSSGMLPPKLCKMMINLTNSNTNDLVLDPFCGSGTMLQELLMLGYTNIIGTDISEKAITDSEANLKWLLNKKNKKYNIENKENNFYINFEDTKINISKEDVKELSEIFDANYINKIICEPYLGPNNIDIRSEYKIKTVIKELEDLYKKAFYSFSKILKPKGEIVMVFPVFKYQHNNKTYFLKLDILKEISEMQFKKVDFNTYINTKQNLNISINNLNKDLQKNDFSNILYFRTDQRVYREIHKFIKV